MKLSRLLLKLFVSISLFTACDSEKNTDLSSVQGDTTPVEITAVQSLRPTKSIVLPGELYPWNKVSIYPKVRGFVRIVQADRGTHVKKGQILALLDAPEILSEFDQAKGQLNAAEATYHQAKVKVSLSKLTYERLSSVSKLKGAVSLQELDQAHIQLLSDSSALASAEGNLKAARSHYQTREELVNYLTIRAPFDGTITERTISPGTLVNTSEAGKPMFVLEDITTLRLTVAIPEIYANALREDTTVRFTISSVPEKSFYASFGRSSGSITEHNRSMTAEFDTRNTSGELKAGMYAQVTFPVRREAPTLFVPKQSVVSSSEKTFVIGLKDHKAEWITVKKGIAADTLVEVFGALDRNDPIVLNASEEIREGQYIRKK